MKYFCFAAAAVAAVVTVVSVVVAAEPPPALFTAEQVTAGEALFQERCSGCHNPDLSEGGHGPGLNTNEFWELWEDKPARELYARIISTMPSDNPGILAPAQALTLVAFILKANGYPPGEERLATPNTLNTIKLHRQKQ